MRYRINNSNYHDFHTYRINKLPPRSYFIPYPDRESADSYTPKEKRYSSSKVRCLNGSWDFKFYPRPGELRHVLDTEETEFDRIDVPSCWQFRGYDKPFYVNMRYQFTYDPPRIPTTEKVGRVFSWKGTDQGIKPRFKDPGEEYNFAGVYRKKLNIENMDKRYIISFLGVASCLDLYVNGNFAGYSEGSHNTAEFDISSFLLQGENELVVVVRRWCNGTYLECQDMFRNNGIFRDVLLYEANPEDIWDIDAVTEKKGDRYTLSLSARTFSDTCVTFSVEGFGIKLSKKLDTENRKANVQFFDLDVREWNDDDPVLYDIYFETKTGCVHERIGFRTVGIRGDVFLVNGRKIKFHGVNHHDTSPVNGYTMSPDEIERDILLCKKFNIDMIRTSHYPPDPLLLELADEHGIYVVDENDLETHGTYSHILPPTYNPITNDRRWRLRYMDRIASLYGRDKIHANTSIVMWSLGNEAGGYINTDAMYNFLRVRSSLPIHYESAIHSKRQAYDVGSEMYASPEKVHDVGERRRRQKRLNDRPYFLCEYAHAMGVGPGDVEPYWKEIYKYDNLMGGCVWEMVDHAVDERIISGREMRHEKSSPEVGSGNFAERDDMEETSTEKIYEGGACRTTVSNYLYGGDFGEWEHDGSFCVDGLFYPDRTPSTGAYIMKFIYRPLRVTCLGGDVFEVFNTRAFSDGSRYRLDFKWNDGTETSIVPEVAPLSRAKVHVKHGQPVNGMRYVDVECVDSKTGDTVSVEQIVFAYEMKTSASVFERKHDGIPVAKRFAVKEGRLLLGEPDDIILSGDKQHTLLYRAATDNDTNVIYINRMLPFEMQTEEVLKSGRIKNGWGVITRIKNKKDEYIIKDKYEKTPDGILVTSRVTSKSGRGFIPRFGKCFRLDEAFDKVRYFGRSGETYCDMKEQFPIAEVSCRVSDMTEPNIRPQESGNRCDCAFAEISDGKRTVRFEAVDAPFELAVKPYRDSELLAMAHRSDEARTGTYVTIQAFQQGIGTGACGPEVARGYKYPANREYTFKFLIKETRLDFALKY